MIDFDKVRQRIAEGYISVQKHPTDDLFIYNYTQKAQFAWEWNEETVACRGLIADSKDRIIKRPFKKFFSLEQLNGKIPDGPFQVYDKLDGSLGILYESSRGIEIATRGSFVSEQAIQATEIVRKKYSHLKWNPANTYLYEIIYPGNRIVVDYGDTEDIFLLAIINTATGEEFDISNFDQFDAGTPMVSQFYYTDIESIKSIQDPKNEGFVLRFESGERIKIKFAEYKRLHKILTGISPRFIWETLRDGKSFDEIIDRVPDEFFKWATGVRDKLQSEYYGVEHQAMIQFKDKGDRKSTALYFQRCENPSILFAMLDKKDYSQHIWKLIKPQPERPFKIDEA